MRNRLFVMVAALLLSAAGARAQDQPAGSAGQQDIPKGTAAPSIPEFGFVNQVDFAVRGTAYDTNADKARFQRYRDLRDGGTLDLFRFGKETGEYEINLQADHIGYRDQRFYGTYNNFGKVKASFEWNQVPLFYSQSTSSLYTDQGNGQLRITNPVARTAVQDGTLKVQNLSRLLGSPFDLQQRRDQAAFNLVAAVAKDVDLKVNVKSAHKQGAMPFGASFGFSADNEVAAPIDHRTTDIGAALEWANAKGMAKIGYDGSWFNNNIPTLTFDSPYRYTDNPNASSSAYVDGSATSQGRMAMWPDSTANAVSAAGAYNFPGHSRLNGVFSIGEWKQNAALLPYTINSAIAAIPLDRQTAEADARITSMNVNFVSRPADSLWFNVRGRRYDFNNRTPEFNVTNYVRLDQVVEPGDNAKPISYTRNYFDADASYTKIPFTALKVGYGLKQSDLSERYLASTIEHTIRASVDTRGNAYAAFGLAYEHSARTSSGFNLASLVAAGQQPALGQFDIANRNRDQVRASVQITPITQFALFASAATGRDNFPDNYFGLTKADTNNYSVGFDVTPLEKVAFGLTYSYEDAKTNQASRNASPGPQFTDPTRDWFDAMTEKVHYVVASVDLIKAIPRTDIRIAYDWNRSNADYVYSLAPVTTLPAPAQLPTVFNELQRGSVDLKYYLTKHVATGFVYWYDTYRVNDFALSPSYVIGNRTLPDGVFLGYFLQPYRANTGWFRLTYLW